MDIDAMMKDSIEIFGEEAQMVAVKQDGLAIQYIHDPSEAVQMTAVNEDELAIQFIHNPSEVVQMAAVEQRGYAIQFIHNPSESVQIEALRRNPSAIRFFKRAWRKNVVKKMTVAELEQILGHRLEIVSSEGPP